MMGLPPRAAFEAMIGWHDLPESWEMLAVESNEIFLGLLAGRLTTMPGLLGAPGRPGKSRDSQGDRHQQRSPAD